MREGDESVGWGVEKSVSFPKLSFVELQSGPKGHAIGTDQHKYSAIVAIKQSICTMPSMPVR